MKNNKLFDQVIAEIDMELLKLAKQGKFDDERVVTLSELRKELQEGESKRDGLKLNANTLLNAGISIGTVLLVLNFEKLNVITSKAFGIGTKLLGR